MTEVKVPLAALAAVSPFMADNDIRYSLNGIQVTVGREEVTCVGTDGHTLGVARFKFPNDETAQFIVKREDVVTILRNIELEDGLHFELGEGYNLGISFGHTAIKTAHIDGKYPDWPKSIKGKEEGRQRAMAQAPYLERISKSWKLCKKYGHFRGVGAIIDTNGPSYPLHARMSDDELTVGIVIMPMRFTDNFGDHLLQEFVSDVE